MEADIAQTFEGLQNLYLSLYNKDISEEYTSHIQPFLESSNKEKITIWKYLIEKLMVILENQNSEIYPLLLNSIKGIYSLFEESTSEKQESPNELIEKIQIENQDLQFTNNELTIALEQLQNENKSYLDKIISNSKLTAEFSISGMKSPTERKEIVPRAPSKKQFMKTRIANSRELTLKQLTDAIEEIYTSKVKFDEKCYDNRQPRETMDQFLYTYLNQKYGLKTLIGEWSVLILKGIEKFESQDAEILLFSKILKHRVDEDFRYTFEKLKENMRQLLKAKIQQRNPYIREVQLNAMLKEKMNGILDEDEWGTIIVSMFSQEESEYMIGNIKNIIEEKSSRLIIGRRNKLLSGKSDATYSEVQNALLKYDLSAHEALLEPFWREFTECDTDKNGILAEEEFRHMCDRIGISEDVDRLLDQVDPYTTGYINFSNCVNLFTYELIKSEDSTQVSVLHSLFFQAQKINN